MEPNEKIFTLAENFSASAKILTAIGDETRQHLILEMMKMGNCMGVRVGDITKKTNLSRPAVSHHLQIMKEQLVSTLQLAMKISKNCRTEVVNKETKLGVNLQWKYWNL